MYKIHQHRSDCMLIKATSEVPCIGQNDCNHKLSASQNDCNHKLSAKFDLSRWQAAACSLTTMGIVGICIHYQNRAKCMNIINIRLKDQATDLLTKLHSTSASTTNRLCEWHSKLHISFSTTVKFL
jgi:hypothetical protein